MGSVFLFCKNDGNNYKNGQRVSFPVIVHLFCSHRRMKANRIGSSVMREAITRLIIELIFFLLFFLM